MSHGPEDNQLGEFLKARRAGLTPSDVGLRDAGSQRRVPGLRREEVADLAGISVDYYTRLEQGRIRASASVLLALESALRLDEDHLAYLYEVAGKTVARPRRQQPQRVRPAMQRLLNQIVDAPAIVLGRRLDILAWNQLAAALYMDFSTVPLAHRNYVRMFFVDARMRSLHADWEYAARACVATLRSQAAGHADDPELASLVGELSLRSDRFRQLWAAHPVTRALGGPNVFSHPIIGDVSLDCDAWVDPNDPDQWIMVITADQGSPGDQALRILASWSADEHRSPAGLVPARQVPAEDDERTARD